MYSFFPFFFAAMPAAEDTSLKYLDPVVVSRLNNMELRARMIVEGFITGLHKSPYHGFSVEFAEHRPYSAGDELRYVDWKVYGKTDRHYVKRFEEETNLRHYVALDTSASMRYREQAPLSKIAYGGYLAAALHYIMVKQRDATGLITFDEEIRDVLPPRSATSWLRQILVRLQQTIDQPPPQKRTGAAKALSEIAERIARRSLVVVITDLFENVGEHEDLLKALRHLRYRGHEVLVFHVLESATERAFDFPDAPMIFRDMETGEEISLQPAHIRENYREAAAFFGNRFRRQCLEYDIDFVELNTEQPYDKALLAYLNKRKKMV